MAGGLASRVDPDVTGRLTAAGFVLCALVAGTFAVSPKFAIGTCAVLLVVALAIGLNSRHLLNPLVPFAIVATLLPLNGIRPVTGVSVGDIALILAGVAVLPFLRRARPPGTVMVTLIGTGLVTAGGLLGMMASQDWDGSIEMLKFIFGAPMMIFIVVLMNPNRRTAVMLLTFYALGGFISSVAALTGHNDPALQRASGLGAHLGHLGLAAMFGFFVMLGWFLQSRVPVVKLAATLVGAVCIYGMLLTGLRSAVLAVFVGVGFIAVCARLKGVLVMVAGIGLGLATLFVLLPYLPANENLERIIGRGDNAGLVGQSNAAHVQVFWDALHVLGTHPWTGIGFGQGLAAHNVFLQTVNLGGLIALIGLIVIWGTFTLLLVQRLELGMTRDSAMQTCVLAAVLGYFVIAQFEPLIWDRHLWFFITLNLYVQRLDPDILRKRARSKGAELTHA